MLSLKNFKIKLLLLFLIFTFAFTSFAYAAESKNTEASNNVYTTENYTEDNSTTADTTNSSNTTIKRSDLYSCQDTITVNDPIDGNAFLFGKNVTINNTINGNAFICADTVTLTKDSYVYSSAFICAKTVVIDGCVYDLYSASDSLKISDSGYIVRDLNSACKDFNLTGFIRRNANLDAESINIDSSSQRIAGNLTYSSNNEISLNQGVVGGAVNYNKYDHTHEMKKTSAAASYVMNFFNTLVYSLIFILIIVLAMHKFADKSENLLTTKFWPILGYGFLGLICIPIISVLLCITIIGIGAAIALIFMYIFILSIAKAIFAVALGKFICDKMKKNNKGMVILISALIIVALWILKNIVIINIFVSLIVCVLGLGIVLYSIFHSKEKTNEPKVAEVAKASSTDTKKE